MLKTYPTLIQCLARISPCVATFMVDHIMTTELALDSRGPHQHRRVDQDSPPPDDGWRFIKAVWWLLAVINHDQLSGHLETVG